jgi:hypothetical protein
LAFSRKPKLNAGTSDVCVGTLVPGSIVAVDVAQPVIKVTFTVVVTLTPLDAFGTVCVTGAWGIVLVPGDAHGMTPCVSVVLFIKDRPAKSSIPGSTSYAGEMTNGPRLATDVPTNRPTWESGS